MTKVKVNTATSEPGFWVGGELGQAVKDAVEEHENVAARNLAYVVEGFARVVPDAAVGVGEARENRRHKLAQVHLCERRSALITDTQPTTTHWSPQTTTQES